MRSITTLAELRENRSGWPAGASIGFVPTMGALHAGHLSLARMARAENDLVIASVFVNPAQFGPNEDLSRYPRDLPRDLESLASAGVDAVFTPTPEVMYPDGFSTWVEPTGSLAERLEAARRPGHFRGVATVVTKLFLLTGPTRAYFGQKDAQQVAVVRRMVTDLNLPVALHIGPTIREPDGLAMSSRNVYLDPAQRTAATALYRALQAGRAALDARRQSATTPTTPTAHNTHNTHNTEPMRAVDAVRAAMAEVIAAEPLVTLDYAEVCDPDTFLPLTSPRAPALLAIAARLGATRLIDNFLLRADGSWNTGRLASQL